jgi:DNA-binding NtrC family response regulator
MTRALLIDPDQEARSAWRRSLESHGVSVTEAEDLESAKAVDFDRIDVVVSSTELPATDGANVLTMFARVPTILIARQGSVRHAVEAMRLGAADYLLRPIDIDELITSIERAAACRPRRHTTPTDAITFYPMIGRCPQMLDLYDRLRKIAPTESTVLIQGESGTGKELVARALHAASRRRQAPMISLNCAVIPEPLIESELFGHEHGASSEDNGARSGLVEAAHGGTLFLDEIGELPLEAQARLLRVLKDGEIRRLGGTQNRHVDVRLIAATHRDLRKLTQTGHFREDLYYRLNVITLSVPPLRDRGSDICEIAVDILRRTCERLDKPGQRFAPETLEVIASYHWPGNVRELENAIERAVILCDGTEIEPALLAIEPQIGAHLAMQAAASASGEASLEEYFINFVIEHEEQLSETELANKLGISRKSLWERRQRLGIPRRGTRKRGARRDVT